MTAEQAPEPTGEGDPDDRSPLFGRYAMILGLASVPLLFLFGLLVLLITVPAMILGGIALRRIADHRATNRRQALTGIIASGVVTALICVGEMLPTGASTTG